MTLTLTTAPYPNPYPNSYPYQVRPAAGHAGHADEGGDVRHQGAEGGLEELQEPPLAAQVGVVLRLTPEVAQGVRVAAATTRAQVQAKDSTELLAEIWLGAVAARAVVWGKVRGCIALSGWAGQPPEGSTCGLGPHVSLRAIGAVFVVRLMDDVFCIYGFMLFVRQGWRLEGTRLAPVGETLAY